MAIGDRRLSTFTISATAAAIAVAVLAYQPDLAARNIAPRVSVDALVQSTPHRQIEPPAVNQLAVFLEHWSHTVADQGNRGAAQADR